MKDPRLVCNGKQRYATKGIARDRKRRTETYSGCKLFVYECETCRGWHLTSMNPVDYRMIKRKQDPDAT